MGNIVWKVVGTAAPSATTTIGRWLVYRCTDVHQSLPDGDSKAHRCDDDVGVHDVDDVDVFEADANDTIIKKPPAKFGKPFVKIYE